MSAAFEIGAFGVLAFVAVAGALGMTTTMSMFRSGIFLMASFIGVAGLFILLSADLIGLLQVMMYVGGFLVMILFMVLVMHDPGGAMMAGMDMAPLERWFSQGLVPRRPEGTGHGHGHGQAHRGHEGHADPGAGHGSRDAHDAHAGAGDGAAEAMPHAAHRGHGAHAGHRHGRPAQGDGHEGGHGGMDMSMVTPVRPLAAWLALGAGALLVGMLVLRPAWPVSEAAPDPDSARRVGQLLMGKYMLAFEGAGFLILIGVFGAVLLARPSTHPDDASRAARVAVDAAPDPIRDDRLAPPGAPDRPAGRPHDHEARHRHGGHTH